MNREGILLDRSCKSAHLHLTKCHFLWRRDDSLASEVKFYFRDMDMEGDGGRADTGPTHARFRWYRRLEAVNRLLSLS